MKKLFKYIENLWLGNDNKPSIRRILAIIFSIDLVRNFHQAGSAVTKMLKLLIEGKNLDSNVVNSISSFLSNEAMIIGVEAGLIAALLSLTTYQNLQLNKPYGGDSYPQEQGGLMQGPTDCIGNTPPHE
jgi:hypothetical protein